MKAISSLPEEAQKLTKKLLEEYPDLENVVLLVDYNPKLHDAGLPALFVAGKETEDMVKQIQQTHSLCLRGASAVNANVLCDLVELYRTIKTEEGETEDDS